MDYETDRIFITMSNEGSGVDSVNADYDAINISYDNGGKTLLTKSTYPLAKISAVAPGGMETTLSTDRQSHDLSHFAPGIWIIKAYDSMGNSKTLKIRI